MKWLYRIVARLMGCRHRWERVEAYRSSYMWPDADSIVCVLRCKKCGWERTTTIR